MLKHPMLPVTACYAAGAAVAAFVPVPLFPGFVVAFGVVGAAAVGPRARPWLLALLLGIVGLLNLEVRTFVLAPHDLRRVTTPEPALVTVRGRLEARPVLRVYGSGRDGAERTQATLDLSAVEIAGEWRAVTGRLAVSTPGALDPEFFGGREVEVFGVLEAPRRPRAPGLFDPRPHFGWQGIHRQLTAQGTNDWRLSSGPQPPAPGMADRFLAWAQRTLARGLPVEDESLRLLWAMTLGWRTALTDEVSAPFMRTGTMHIFAISGLHIALIAGMLVALLRVLQVPRGATGLGVVPLIWFYTAATGWQPSAIRSTLMMTVVIAGWALRRPGNLVNSLLGSAFLILLWDPRQLFQASFQLSFFVVLSMALMGPPLARWVDTVLRTDPLLPVELLPRWRRFVHPGLRYVMLSLVVSLAAWVGSLPLIAHYFHLVTPVGLVLNLLVVPLSSLALMCNLGALACGDWLPAVTGLFNHSAWFWMTLLVGASERAAGFPGACWYVSGPGAWGVITYYVWLVAVASGAALAPGRRRAWAAGAILMGVGFAVHAWHGRGEVALTLLPLRGGSALWVDGPGRADDVLVDCGNEFAAAHTVVPFLHAQGLNRLPNLLLTHGDVRHVGGAMPVATNFRPAAIWGGPGPFRSPSYREFLRVARDVATVPRTLVRGDQVAGWDVWHPAAADRFPRADDASLVLAREFGRVRVVVVSDLGRSGQEALLARGPCPRADIVITGLPTEGEPLRADLLAALRPRLILVSDDVQPVSARAGPGLRRRLLGAAESVVFTAETGAVSLHIRRDAWVVRDVDGRTLAAARAGDGPDGGLQAPWDSPTDATADRAPGDD